MAIKLNKTNLVRNLADKKVLVPYIERALSEEFDWEYSFESKKGDDGWHPSGDCMPSLRDLYWKAKDPQRETLTANSYKNFQVGHFWHAYLQHALLHRADIGLVEEDIERRGIQGWGVTNRLPGRPVGWGTVLYEQWHYATGSGDIAPCDIPGCGTYVVDFKTMGSHDYRRNALPDWCAEKYEAQINIYMSFFDLEQGLIVAINKDTGHDMKEFLFKRNQPLIDAIYKKWTLASECIKEDIEPPNDDAALPFRGPG